MDYTDWMLWKLVAFVALAFVYGLWRGLTGQPLQRGPRDTETAGDR